MASIHLYVCISKIGKQQTKKRNQNTKKGKKCEPRKKFSVIHFIRHIAHIQRQIVNDREKETQSQRIRAKAPRNLLYKNCLLFPLSRATTNAFNAFSLYHESFSILSSYSKLVNSRHTNSIACINTKQHEKKYFFYFFFLFLRNFICWVQALECIVDNTQSRIILSFLL